MEMEMEMDKSSTYPPTLPPSPPPGPEMSFVSGTTIENTPPNHPSRLPSQSLTQEIPVLSGISALIGPDLTGLGSDEIGAWRVTGTATTETNASDLVPFISSAIDGEVWGTRDMGDGALDQGTKAGLELGEAEKRLGNEALNLSRRFLNHPEREVDPVREMLNREAQEAAIETTSPTTITKGENEARMAKSEKEDTFHSSPPNIQLRFSSLGEGMLYPSTSGAEIDEGILPVLQRSIVLPPTSPISTSQIEMIAATVLRSGVQNIETVDKAKRNLSGERSSATDPEGAGELFAGQIPTTLEAPQQMFALDLAVTSELDIPPPSNVYNPPDDGLVRLSALRNEEEPHEEVEGTSPDAEGTIDKTLSASAMLPPPAPILTQESNDFDDIPLPQLKTQNFPLKKPTMKVEIPDSEVDEDEELSSSSRESERAHEKIHSSPSQERGSPPNRSVSAPAGRNEVAGPALSEVLGPRIGGIHNPEFEFARIAPIDSFQDLKQDDLSSLKVQVAGLELSQLPFCGRGPSLCKTNDGAVIEELASEADGNAKSLSASWSEYLQHIAIAPADEDKPALPDEEITIANENLDVTISTQSYDFSVERKAVGPVAVKETPRSSEHPNTAEVPDSKSADEDLSLPQVEGMGNAAMLEQSNEIHPNDQPCHGFVSLGLIGARSIDDEDMVIQEEKVRVIPDSTEPVSSSKQSSGIKNISQKAENVLKANTTEVKLPTNDEVSKATVPARDGIESPPSSSQSSIQQPSTVVDIPPIVPPSRVLTRKRASPAPENSVQSPAEPRITSSPPVAPPKKKQKKGLDDVDNVDVEGEVAQEERVVKSKDELLMDELRAMKVASLQARNSFLEAEIARVRAKLEEVTSDLEHPAAGTVKTHIHLLHQYNDIRDVGQGLIGMIADNRGVRVRELYDEFGVGLQD